jgi:hypothetical protein
MDNLPGILNFVVKNQAPTIGTATLFGANIVLNDPDNYLPNTVLIYYRGNLSNKIAYESDGVLVLLSPLNGTESIYEALNFGMVIDGVLISSGLLVSYTPLQASAAFGNPVILNNYFSSYTIPVVPEPPQSPGCSPGVTITPDFSVPYEQVLRDTLPSPFTAKTWRVQSANATQLDENLNFTETNIYGEVYFSPFSLDTQVSGFQYEKNIVVFDKKFHVTANTYISFSVLPNTSLNLTVFVAERFNHARTLHKLKNITSFKEWQDPIQPIKNLKMIA